MTKKPFVKVQSHNPVGVPEEVAAIRGAIRKFMDTKDNQGRTVGSAKHGVYAFYDYDDKPIYVGQTKESLRGRISRHLTNQRTDAVAMNVLDPFEVASIEVWPLYFPPGTEDETIKQYLNAAEYAVFQQVLQASQLHAVLNEEEIAPTEKLELPQSYRDKIVPSAVFEARSHPDLRIARRANTIARLAQVVSERDVSLGLRRTLQTQARRLQLLADRRFAEFVGAGISLPIEKVGEETGEHLSDTD